MPQVGPSPTRTRHPHRNDATTLSAGSSTPPSPKALRPYLTDIWSGDEVRNMREARGLSRRALAELIGYSQWTIRGWEYGTKRIPPSLSPVLYEVLDQIAAHVAEEKALKKRRLQEALAG